MPSLVSNNALYGAYILRCYKTKKY